MPSGIGKIGPSDSTSKPQMVEQLGFRIQAADDLPQAFPVRQLAKPERQGMILLSQDARRFSIGELFE